MLLKTNEMLLKFIVGKLAEHF